MSNNYNWHKAVSDLTRMYWQHQRHKQQQNSNIELAHTAIKDLENQQYIIGQQLAGLGIKYFPKLEDLDSGELNKYMGV